MIDFEIEPSVLKRVKMFHMVADSVMRPISREFDEKEPPAVKTMGGQRDGGIVDGSSQEKGSPERIQQWRGERATRCATSIPSLPPRSGAGRCRTVPRDPECRPRRRGGYGGGNAGAERALPVPFPRRRAEVGRDGDYRARLRFRSSQLLPPRRARAMITCSRDQQFSYGRRPRGEVGRLHRGVGDRRARGRPGIKPFVVEHGTPGMTVVRVENKLGHRAS